VISIKESGSNLLESSSHFPARTAKATTPVARLFAVQTQKPTTDWTQQCAEGIQWCLGRPFFVNVKLFSRAKSQFQRNRRPTIYRCKRASAAIFTASHEYV